MHFNTDSENKKGAQYKQPPKLGNIRRALWAIGPEMQPTQHKATSSPVPC